MLIVSFLFSIAIVLFLKNLSRTGVLPLLSFALPIFFLACFSFEYATVSFLNSDEIFYKISAGNAIESWDAGRALWIFINYLILNDIIYSGDVLLKLVNVPLFVFLIYTLWSLFDRNKYIFFIPLMLPYFCYIAQTNLRDIAILLWIALFFLGLKHGGKSLYLSLLCLVLLIFTRQFLIPIILASALFGVVFSSSKNSTGRYKARYLGILIITVCFGLFFSESIASRVAAHAQWLEYTTGEGRSSFSEQQSTFTPSGNLFYDFVRGSVLYVFGPRPHSILIRAIYDGGTEMWGLTDDIVRFLHQTGYYIVLAYLLLNFKKALSVIQSMSPSLIGLSIVLFSYMPIYSFHLFGTTHQRLKIPFQVLLFLISCLIVTRKKEMLL